MREIDFVSRWGGEEFVIALVDSPLEDSQKVAEKLRVIIENDSLFKSYVHHSISASFGLMQIQKGDIQEEIYKRRYFKEPIRLFIELKMRGEIE